MFITLEGFVYSNVEAQIYKSIIKHDIVYDIVFKPYDPCPITVIVFQTATFTQCTELWMWLHKHIQYDCQIVFYKENEEVNKDAENSKED
jgi:hypothetical protein